MNSADTWADDGGAMSSRWEDDIYENSRMYNMRTAYKPGFKSSISPSEVKESDVEVFKSELFIRSLAESIDHAKSVSGRRHIKAERYERVGQFITSLRSKISFGYSDRALKSVLFDKGIWYDIGVLESRTSCRNITDHTYLLLEEALVKAQAYRKSSEDEFGSEESPENIREGLKDLRAELTIQRQLSTRMEALNQRADQVIDKIADVCERAVA